MSKLNISVIVAARDEYIDQLKSIITPLLIQGFNSIYEDAVDFSRGKNILYKFQELLKEIPNWNQTILQAESKRIKQKCGYIMDIVTAIFVSNVKILASIRLKGNNDNIRVKIPTSDIFIHSIYIEAAQQIFYDPRLFDHRQTNNFQEKKEIVKKIIRNAIDITIRQMLPFDNILQEYLKKSLDDNAENDSDDDDTEPEPVSDSDEESVDEDDIDNNEFDETGIESDIKQIGLGGPVNEPPSYNSLFKKEEEQSDSESGSDFEENFPPQQQLPPPQLSPPPPPQMQQQSGLQPLFQANYQQPPPPPPQQNYQQPQPQPQPGQNQQPHNQQNERFSFF
jgi:hypothetical protein